MGDRKGRLCIRPFIHGDWLLGSRSGCLCICTIVTPLQPHDHMHVVRHHHEGIQINRGEPPRQGGPYVSNDPSYYRVIQRALAIVCADRHEVRAREGIIIAAQADRSAAMLLWITLRDGLWTRRPLWVYLWSARVGHGTRQPREVGCAYSLAAIASASSSARREPIITL